MLTHEQRQAVIQYVFTVCKDDPSIVKELIDACTAGVKEFASKQNDSSSKMAFIMTQILDTHKDAKAFGPFKRVEILDVVAPWLDGSKWYKEEREMLDKQ